MMHPTIDIKTFLKPGVRAHLAGIGGVSMCPLAEVLLGMGLRSFSMHPSQILVVKQEILRADTSKLAPWAQAVLQSDEPADLLAS